MPDPAETSRVRLSYIQEVNFGVTPVGNLTDFRFTGESFKQITAAQASNEIVSDRQTADIARTSVHAAGDINFEMIATAHDDFILAALGSAGWSAAVTVTAATISAASGDNSFNDSGAGFGSMVANQWIRVTGFANAANNGYFKIVTKTSSKLVVSGGTLVTAAASPSITVVLGAQAVNGITKTSFSIERKYTDLTTTFVNYLGMTVSGMTLTAKAEAMITGSVSFMGKKELSATATIGTGYVAANTNDVMNAVDHVVAVLEGGSAVSDVNDVDFTINSNLRTRNIVGLLGPKSMGLGEFSVTGKAQMYFADGTIMDKYLGFTSTSLALQLLDGAGKGYIFEWPEVKYTDGVRVAGGKSQDVMADMTFMTKKDPTEGITMRVVRF